MALKPEAFQKCFQDWIAQAIRNDDSGLDRLIAIDGKMCRRSHDASQQLGPLHIVSARASEVETALGQVATEAKSNEITAIPQLLKQIDLTDSLITIDAMGCQKEIARDIVDGDFAISVKDDQPKLKETIEAYFEKHLECDLEDLKYRCQSGAIESTIRRVINLRLKGNGIYWTEDNRVVARGRARTPWLRPCHRHMPRTTNKVFVSFRSITSII